jgi:hypothetical protein
MAFSMIDGREADELAQCAHAPADGLGGSAARQVAGGLHEDRLA